MKVHLTFSSGTKYQTYTLFFFFFFLRRITKTCGNHFFWNVTEDLQNPNKKHVFLLSHTVSFIFSTKQLLSLNRNSHSHEDTRWIHTNSECGVWFQYSYRCSIKCLCYIVNRWKRRSKIAQAEVKKSWSTCSAEVDNSKCKAALWHNGTGPKFNVASLDIGKKKTNQINSLPSKNQSHFDKASAIKKKMKKFQITAMKQPSWVN